PGEMALTDTRHFAGGRLNVSAAPFRVGADFSVFDHLKYIAISNESFPVPEKGSVTISSQITAQTPGTIPGLAINGVYGPPGSWADPSSPPPAGLAPYSATVMQGQQAGVVMNVIDFCTGQLFDWFIAGDTAFTLIERLPTNVTGNTANPGCPGATHVGRDKMYTQIVDEIPLDGSVPHTVAIRYTAMQNAVEYLLDGKRVSRVKNVGVPLDVQGVNYTGTYPSLGPGESLAGQIGSLSIGHGLFSLIDAFPYQHPDSPELSVSIPVGDSTPAGAGKARLFGQGAIGTFDNFTVTTKETPAADE
ncbi:MAG: DUF6081 family protein, partial [Actinomycetota bacterium]|nr:DUF6081 family protein [Actinomycetota bacterium]